MGCDFRNLEIWRLGYNLVLDVYPLLGSFPDGEERNLVDRLRRVVTDLPILLLGAGSQSKRSSSLRRALRSAKELELLLMLAHDLGYVERDIYDFAMKKLREFMVEISASID